MTVLFDPDTALRTWWCRDRSDFDAVGARPEVEDHVRLLERIAAIHADEETFVIDGVCWPCRDGVSFNVTRRFVGVGVPAGHPNWRESLRCPQCKMNNRRRATCRFLERLLSDIDAPDVYAMESTTPVVTWLRNVESLGSLATSDYLVDMPPDKVPPGVRHEDAEHLSFEDGSFDLVMSNDVLEHVAHPDLALEEFRRVLRPGGKLLLNVPFRPRLDANHRRAELVDGELVHIDKPVYHAHPFDKRGSLVFNDFGWELVDQLGELFSDVGVVRYSSELYGHLGPSLSVFIATP